MNVTKLARAPKSSKVAAKVKKALVCTFVVFAFSLDASGAFDAVVIQSRIDALVACVRPALPFPGASEDGELPSDHSARSKWFVAWPASPDDTRIVVKANPLHPETQKAAAEAMDGINAAVAAAERRAQAAYDKALEELRRTGKGSDLESITLDDEGIAGERIDAELELVIELQPAASFEIASSQAPEVAAGVRGATWTVTVPANTYRAKRGADLREHFRAAEVRVYLGPVQKPVVTRKADDPVFLVNLPAGGDGFAVVLRGNETLLKQVTASADWSTLVQR
jgi:hypothetical protein